jgi:hypothetical protein
MTITPISGSFRYTLGVPIGPRSCTAPRTAFAARPRSKVGTYLPLKRSKALYSVPRRSLPRRFQAAKSTPGRAPLGSSL